MNVVDILGTPIHDAAGAPSYFESSCTAPAMPIAESPSAGAQRGRGWLIVGVAVALAVGVAGGWIWGKTGTKSPSLGVTSPVETMPASVAGAAELFATLYLSGTASPDSLTGLYAGEIAPTSGAWVNDTAAITGVNVGSDLWEVTVAVDSLVLIDGAYVPAALSYFTVPISTAAGHPVALAAPARVPPPITPSQPASFSTDVAPDQTTTATSFIEHYLTGDPDVRRYLAATSGIELFPIPPYALASVTVAGADSLGRVFVVATAETSEGTIHRLEYLLTLSMDAGVWSVSDLGAAGR